MSRKKIITTLRRSACIFAVVLFAGAAFDQEAHTFAGSSHRQLGKTQTEGESITAPQDVKDIPAVKVKAGDNDKMRYILMGPKKNASEPKLGYKLIVVLPGGDGSEDFYPFVCRLYKHAMDDDVIVAQPIAVSWRPHQKVIWPTQKTRVPGQKFTTEEFTEAVIADVQKRHAIDKRYIFTLSWSSSGPAAYAMALQKKTAVTGSYIMMSVFKPAWLPPLQNAKGRVFLIEHSPQDRVCPIQMAKMAQRQLTSAGAKVKFVTYTGGHGWHGDMFERTRQGIQWLVKQQK